MEWIGYGSTRDDRREHVEPAFQQDEDIKGSIEVGKLADLVVLSQNLLAIKPNAILDTTVLYTIIGGKIVYQGT